jgi:hypothetical protein
MDFDTYFERLVLREGGWLRSAKPDIKAHWPYVPPELERAAFALYEELFGKRTMTYWPGLDEWFYRVNRELNQQRPIELMSSTEGVRSIHAIFERLAAGALG